MEQTTGRHDRGSGSHWRVQEGVRLVAEEQSSYSSSASMTAPGAMQKPGMPPGQPTWR
jgi:hypothetical protein